MVRRAPQLSGQDFSRRWPTLSRNSLEPRSSQMARDFVLKRFIRLQPIVFGPFPRPAPPPCFQPSPNFLGCPRSVFGGTIAARNLECPPDGDLAG